MSAKHMAEHREPGNGNGDESGPQRSFPKTHVNYWKARLEHRSYTQDGETFEVPEWSVRIHFEGIRKSFDLETANKEDAAVKARDIYLSLVAKGWTNTLAELTPQQPVQPAAVVSSATVGDFLAEVERTSTLKTKTFRQYAQALRRLTAYIRGVKADPSRYDYRTGGLDAWRKQIEATPLSAITPAAVADWKIAYHNPRMPNP